MVQRSLLSTSKKGFCLEEKTNLKMNGKRFTDSTLIYKILMVVEWNMALL